MRRSLLIFICVCFLAGCSSQTPAVSRELWAMDTYMQLQVTGTDAETAARQLEEMIHQL